MNQGEAKTHNRHPGQQFLKNKTFCFYTIQRAEPLPDTEPDNISAHKKVKYYYFVVLLVRFERQMLETSH